MPNELASCLLGSFDAWEKQRFPPFSPRGAICSLGCCGQPVWVSALWLQQEMGLVCCKVVVVMSLLQPRAILLVERT